MVAHVATVLMELISKFLAVARSDPKTSGTSLNSFCAGDAVSLKCNNSENHDVLNTSTQLGLICKNQLHSCCSKWSLTCLVSLAHRFAVAVGAISNAHCFTLFKT